jgi:hypothetical protein
VSNDNAERLRRAVSARAECGWGCFCDACWAAACAAEKRHRRGHQSDVLGGELAVADALWSLSYDVDADDALAALEARSARERRAYRDRASQGLPEALEPGRSDQA